MTAQLFKPCSRLQPFSPSATMAVGFPSVEGIVEGVCGANISVPIVFFFIIFEFFQHNISAEALLTQW